MNSKINRVKEGVSIRLQRSVTGALSQSKIAAQGMNGVQMGNRLYSPHISERAFSPDCVRCELINGSSDAVPAEVDHVHPKGTGRK